MAPSRWLDRGDAREEGQLKPGIPQSKLDEWRALAEAMERTGEQYADVVAALLDEVEAARSLLRDEVLPFIEHTVKDYDCAKGIVLAERLAVFLK